MNYLTYLLKGFGYKDWTDFSSTVFKLLYMKSAAKWLSLAAVLGTARTLVDNLFGLDIIVFVAFVFLICAEFFSGVKAARKVDGERFKSRKMGRMFLKIGVYITIVAVLHAFKRQVEIPDLFGLELNPFTWIYYMVFIGIVLQLLISWFENLGRLGYKETQTLAGFILRKFNRWFEFDGTKDNGEE